MAKISHLIIVLSILTLIRESYSKANAADKTDARFKNFTEQSHFVDKTGLLLEFLKTPNNTYDYISCPSGFAKTTNLLMIKDYVQIEPDNLGRPKQRMVSTAYNSFRNTIIDKELGKVKDDIASHPVIFVSLRVDFAEQASDANSNVTDAELVATLNELVYKIVEEYEWLWKLMESPPDTTKVKYSFEKWEIEFMQKAFKKQLTHVELETSLHSLIKILYNYFKKRVIVLVDDLDYVMRKAILVHCSKCEPFQQSVNKMLREALGTGKDMVSYAMMTGISRLPLLGSNITGCVPLNEHVFLSEHKYEDYFGFLVNDLRQLCTKHKCDKSELEQVQELYEGYETKFEHRKLLNPYSVSKYFEDRGYHEKIRPLKVHWIWGSEEQDFVTKFLNVSLQFITILAKVVAYNSFIYSSIEDYGPSPYSKLTKLSQHNYDRYCTNESDPITNLIPFCFENGLFSYTLEMNEYFLPNDEIHQQISKTLTSYYKKSGLDFESLAAALKNLLGGFNTNVPEIKKAFDSAMNKLFANVPAQAPTQFLLLSILRQTILANRDFTITEEKKISRKGRCEITYASIFDRSAVHISITNGKTAKQALKLAPGFGRKKHTTKSVYVGINLDSKKEIEILTEVKTPK